MNTFLPFPDFNLSLSTLDNKRLNKQNVESYQMINGQWKNHPCSKMWADKIDSLKYYFNVGLNIWLKRGFKSKFDFYDVNECLVEFPEILYFTHRINLLRKDYDYYSNSFRMHSEVILKQDLHNYPMGYYWPIQCGPNSKKHTENWIKFWRGNE